MPKKLRPAVDLIAFKCRTLKVNVAKYGIARRATDDSIIRRRKDVIWMPEYLNPYPANVENMVTS
jgi:hypothetical protein